MAWDQHADRRKHRRVDLRLLLQFDDPDSKSEGRKTRMETLNFSAGGFYCRLNRKTPPLTRLALRFVFPPFGRDNTEERAVDCEAVVVRCEPEPGDSGDFRVAACFTDLCPEDRVYIQEYLEWYQTVYCEGEEPGDEYDRDAEEEAA